MEIAGQSMETGSYICFTHCMYPVKVAIPGLPGANKLYNLQSLLLIFFSPKLVKKNIVICIIIVLRNINYYRCECS